MNNQELKRTIHLSSKQHLIFVDELNDSSHNFVIDSKHQEYYIIDWTDQSSKHEFNFQIEKETSLNLYYLCITQNGNHKSTFKFNHESASQLNMYGKLFAGKTANVNCDAFIIIGKTDYDVNSDQQINGFLFSDQANINAIPALYVDNNAIKATHAVNIGHIDQMRMFYLQTKGFDEKEATNILIENEICFLKNLKNKEDDENNILLSNVFNKIKAML
ncbi:MAG: SufD family Fe-S cluster assembly protein [Mycoplasma sp.]